MFPAFNWLEYMAPEILFTFPSPNPYPTCALTNSNSVAMYSKWPPAFVTYNSRAICLCMTMYPDKVIPCQDLH